MACLQLAFFSTIFDMAISSIIWVGLLIKYVGIYFDDKICESINSWCYLSLSDFRILYQIFPFDKEGRYDKILR